jgi:hypothetical protein
MGSVSSLNDLIEEWPDRDQKERRAGKERFTPATCWAK